MRATMQAQQARRPSTDEQVAIFVFHDGFYAVASHLRFLAIGIYKPCVLIIKCIEGLILRVEIRQTTIGTNPYRAILGGEKGIYDTLTFRWKKECVERPSAFVHPDETIASTQPEIVVVVFGDGAYGVVGQNARRIDVRLVGLHGISIIRFDT